MNLDAFQMMFYVGIVSFVYSCIAMSVERRVGGAEENSRQTDVTQHRLEEKQKGEHGGSAVLRVWRSGGTRPSTGQDIVVNEHHKKLKLEET